MFANALPNREFFDAPAATRPARNVTCRPSARLSVMVIALSASAGRTIT